MKRTTIPLLLLLALALPLAVRAQDATDPLEAALADPPATGILVTFVLEGTPAAEVGLEPGDVVVAYAGTATPSLEALAARKAEVAGEATVELVYVRDGTRRTATVPSGQIGFNGTPVTKGEPPAPLPPATGVEFDFSSLEGKPVDAWFSFHLGDGPKAGYEHVVLKRDGDRIYQVSEVAFDGGEDFGRQHFLVTVVTTAEPRPRLVMYRMELPLAGWSGTGLLVEGEDGPHLEFTARTAEGTERTGPIAMPAGVVPTYFVESLARFMPREEGASFHFRPLNEGGGAYRLPSALVCRGRESIESGGGTAPAWRYEWVDLGGTVGSTFWVAEDGRVLKADWNGATGRLVTREEALADLPEDLRPLR